MNSVRTGRPAQGARRPIEWGAIWLSFQLRRQDGGRRAGTAERRPVSKRLMIHRLQRLGSDLRYAARGLRRSPGFAALAAATVAIGIGASTAVFSVVDLLLFRPLPYPAPEELVSVGFSGPIDNNEFQIGGSYLDWKERQTAFREMTSMYPAAECEEVGGQRPERIHCQQVEANFLRTLGIAPMLGRDLRAEDDVPGAPRVALLGYGYWKAR